MPWVGGEAKLQRNPEAAADPREHSMLCSSKRLAWLCSIVAQLTPQRFGFCEVRKCLAEVDYVWSKRWCEKQIHLQYITGYLWL